MLKYIPETIPVMKGKGLIISPVLRVVTHPPNTHPKSAIRNDWTAVQVIARDGERWFGTERAFIDSSLRMVMAINPADEVLRKWEDAA